jgi:SAM-dependent methyltransferase
MTVGQRSNKNLRSRFDELYDSSIVGAGFGETDEYYKWDRERYWRSLNFLCQLEIATPASLLEIGGGQLALLFKKLFNDDCSVADISERYSAPIQKEGIPFFKYNLMDPPSSAHEGIFDVIVLLEVIEHIPVPAHVIFERIKCFLKPTGILFLTTPNLFRIRNFIRMFLGIEFLAHFQLPEPEQGLGHQLEYSAHHLRWQLERAGMEIIMLKHDELGRIGHSPKARLGRRLLAPLGLRPIWRDGLVAAARKASTKNKTLNG